MGWGIQLAKQSKARHTTPYSSSKTRHCLINSIALSSSTSPFPRLCVCALSLGQRCIVDYLGRRGHRHHWPDIEAREQHPGERDAGIDARAKLPQIMAGPEAVVDGVVAIVAGVVQVEAKRRAARRRTGSGQNKEGEDAGDQAEEGGKEERDGDR